MTDDLPQLVQRLGLPWQCTSFDPEGGTQCHERHRGDVDLWCSACIVNQLATALDSLTRALAEQQAENARLRDLFAPISERTRVELEMAVMPDLLDSDRAGAGRLARILIGWHTAESALTAAVREARAETEKAISERDEARGLHQELMFQVGKKYPGETRHETAKRYLREHEDHCNQGGPAASRAADPTGEK